MVNFIYRFLRLQTIASRITFWVIVLIFASGLLHSFSYMSLDKADRINEAQTDMEYALNNQKKIMESWAHERIKDVRYLANLPEAKDMKIETMYETYLRFTKYDDELRGIVTLDKDGYVLMDSLKEGPLSTEISLDERAYFKAAKKGEEYIYDVISTDTDKKPVIIFSAPILSVNHDFQGVLFSSTYLVKVKELLSQSIQGETGRMTLINHEGRVLFQLNDGKEIETPINEGEKLKTEIVHNILNDKTIYKTYKNSNDVEVIGSYTGLFDDRYFLINEIEMNEVLKSHYHMVAIQLSIALIIVVISIVFIIPITNHLVQPMVHLIQALTKMKEGKYNTQLDISLFNDSPTELRQSIKVFNEMSERIYESKETLRRLSSTDVLTGVANRRMLDEYLEQEWNQAIKKQTPLSIAFLDIDLFKEFNDSFGHQHGDECLKRVSYSINDSVRRSKDFVARYGGEEFIIVLPETDSEGATTVAERIRRDVQDLQIENPGNELGPFVTVSIGVSSVIPSSDILKENLISLADEALYEAKSSGRNKVITKKLNKK